MLKDETKRDSSIFMTPKVMFFISFLLSFIVAALVIVETENHNLIVARAKALRVTGNYVSSLERVVNNNLSVNYSLSMLIHEGEEGRIEKLEEFGKQILHLYPDIANISLAPNGIVQEIIPLEGNEGAVGHNLFEDEERVTEALKTKEAGVLTVAGPFNLIQGGEKSIIGRLPVFISDDHGNQNFWGFTSTVMSVDVILDEVKMEALKEIGYDYELWRSNPDTGGKEIIALSGSPVIEAEVQRVILPNEEWFLGVSPVGGWRNKQQFLISCIIAIIFSTLIAILFWMVAKLRISKLSLEKIAFYDGLTGLPNRRLFFDRLQQAMEYSKREGSLLAVCYMDLDDFKAVNDSLGHKAGDQVLVETSKRYKNIIRATDTISRLGGDEFAILLSDLRNKEECVEILERIKSITREPIIFEGYPIMTSISIGVTLFPYDDSGDETLLRHADVALYKVKEDGKGQYKFYDPN